MPYLEEYRGGGLTTLPNDNTVPMVYANGEYVPAYFLGGLWKGIRKALPTIAGLAASSIPFGDTAKKILSPALGANCPSTFKVSAITSTKQQKLIFA